jgi:hypothetical protein
MRGLEPSLLLYDTDCLLQLFITNQVRLLRWLKSHYRLGAAIVPEVEAEASWNARYRDRFESDVRKAISTGTISVFDYSRPELQLQDILATPQAEVTMRAIINTGREYALRVGRGEAYSHAVCVHLGLPLLSHDISAIKILLEHGQRTAVPTLRFFDLVALAYGTGKMSARDCDSVRQALDRAKEFLPRAFVRASFEDGLGKFDRRLLDLEECTTGRPPACVKYDDPFVLQQA